MTRFVNHETGASLAAPDNQLNFNRIFTEEFDLRGRLEKCFLDNHALPHTGKVDLLGSHGIELGHHSLRSFGSYR